MSLATATLLFFSAVLGGGINSVAGGGSFITFPTLLFTGVAPIPANATNTVALWPGSVASIPPYRDTINTQRQTLISLTIISLAGGLVGAIVLLNTPPGIFKAILPYLLLGATVIFAFGGTITKAVRGAHVPDPERHLGWPARVGFGILLFIIAMYGGFFGGGMSILILALFALMEMQDIHAMNGLKVLLASGINGIAALTFILLGKILWPEAVVMIVGAVIGGYFGATIARSVAPQYVRWFVIAVGFTISAIFFIRR